MMVGLGAAGGGGGGGAGGAREQCPETFRKPHKLRRR